MMFEDQMTTVSPYMFPEEKRKEQCRENKEERTPPVVECGDSGLEKAFGNFLKS